ncbi:MAG: VIT and VWA domain-containing protein [Phycisphaerales bacterium]
MHADDRNPRSPRRRSSTRGPGAAALALALATLAGAALAPLAAAQSTAAPRWELTPSTRAVLPQIGRAAGQPAIAVTDVSAVVEIAGRVATTTLELGVANRGARPEEAVLLVPVPAGATVTGIDFSGPASEPTAKLLPQDEARRIYDGIVAKERDPALLEWAGWNLVRTSLFPVPANGTQRLRVRWETLLTGPDGRLDYTLPRSDIAGGPAWNIVVRVRGAGVAAAYSPSHEIAVERGADALVARCTPRAPGSFRLSVVRAEAPAATVLTYPDPSIGGGFYLLLAAAPAAGDAPAMPREVTLVLDRSGSLAGPAFDRAKIAATRIVEGLEAQDRANIVDFSNGVTKFAPAPVPLTPANRQALCAHIAALVPGGGTNIHDALLEALRQPTPPAGTLAAVLFVTDGVPTIGRTREQEIRTLVDAGNAAHRRIFTVGLGNDVNVPLLDRVADATRAVATYLETDQELVSKLPEVAQRLRGPALADATLAVLDASGAPAPGRTDEMLPTVLPDLFRGGTLVALGRYRGDAPFTLQLTGRGPAGEVKLRVPVDPAQASTANAFVPRLWASRRIAVLVDAVRQQGLDARVDASDPRWRELVGEIVRLSTTYGILTEYTAMLATEGSAFRDLRALEASCMSNLQTRAVQTRSGAAAVNQGVNWNRQKLEQTQSATVAYADASGAQVRAAALNQCADRNFYKVGPAWADASLAGTQEPAQEEIAFGSPRHRELLWELVSEGRQSALALEGDILLRHRGTVLLVHNGACANATP